MSRFFRADSVFFVLVFGLALYGYRSHGFFDAGCLWHIVVGDIILTSGFPRTDPFTYTFAGHFWIPQQWGAEVLMSLAHSIGGFDTLLLMLATSLAGFATWIFSRMRAGGMGIPLAAGLTLAAGMAGAFHFCARPHMATVFFMGWIMACIVDYEKSRVSIWRIAGLIPVCVVWVNLHGGMLGGVFTLGIAVAGWIGVYVARSIVEKSGSIQTGLAATTIQNSRQAGLFIAIVLCCLLTPFVNPFGWGMIETWQRIVGSKVMTQVVNEHMPLDIHHPSGWVVLGFGAIYLGALLSTFPRLPRISWLIPLVWLALSIRSIRHGPLFGVVGAIALADLWQHTYWYRLFLKHGDTFSVPPNDTDEQLDWRTWTLPATVVMGVFALQLLGVRGWAQLDESKIPVDLVPVLREELDKLPPDRHIYNDSNLGGFMIYHFPTTKIFMDDRFELYGDDWLANYAWVIWNDPGQVDRWCDEYGCDLVLLKSGPYSPPLTNYFDSLPMKWERVITGRGAVLYKRRN